MEWNFHAISDLLIFVQGMLLGILFLTNPKGIRSANLLLGLFIIFYNFSALHGFFLSSGITYDNPWLLGIPSLFLFWYGPLLYFYTSALTNPEFSWKKKYYWLFLPAILELTGNFVMLSMGGERLIDLAGNDTFSFWMALESLLASFFSLYFVIRSLMIIKGEHEKNGLSSLKVKWLKLILGYFLIRFLFWSLYFILGFLYEWDYDLVKHTNLVVSFLTIMDFVAVFGTSVFSFHHLNNLHQRKKERSFILHTEKEELYFKKLRAFMEEEKLYRKQELKMSELAELLNTNVKYISQVISRQSGGNFTSFVNGYRVEEIKQRILDPHFRHLTLAAIAEGSGFKSKTTFNRVFKEISGLSPNEYRKQSLVNS